MSGRRITSHSAAPTLERQSAKYALLYEDSHGGERLSVSFERLKQLPGIKIQQGGIDMVLVDAGEDLDWLISALMQIREDYRGSTISKPAYRPRAGAATVAVG